MVSSFWEGTTEEVQDGKSLCTDLTDVQYWVLTIKQGKHALWNVLRQQNLEEYICLSSLHNYVNIQSTGRLKGP